MDRPCAFAVGDRAVHRSQRLDTLNTVEWIVYYVSGSPDVACRAVVPGLVLRAGTTIYAMHVLECTFHEAELRKIDGTGKEAS